jgi:hypothetical protein
MGTCKSKERTKHHSEVVESIQAVILAKTILGELTEKTRVSSWRQNGVFITLSFEFATDAYPSRESVEIQRLQPRRRRKIQHSSKLGSTLEEPISPSPYTKNLHLTVKMQPSDQTPGDTPVMVDPLAPSRQSIRRGSYSVRVASGACASVVTSHFNHDGQSKVASAPHAPVISAHFDVHRMDLPVGVAVKPGKKSGSRPIPNNDA